MPLNDITFTLTGGGLNRPLPGEDHISGLLGYIATGSIPTGFTTVREHAVYDIAGAEALGLARGSATTGKMWYHADRALKANPGMKLWIGIYPTPASTYDFTEVATLQNAAGGEIRQMAVYAPALTYATTQVVALQTVAASLEAVHKPLVILYAANISAVSDITTLGTLTSSAANRVSVVIGQDFSGAGLAEFTANGAYPSALGAVLGMVSKAAVNENIGWVSKFNFSDGIEFNVIGFANGQKVSALSDSALSGLNDKGYIFLRKLVGIEGSYANDSHTATAVTDDLAYLENVRVYQKAIRGQRTTILPSLSSPLTVNADGTLDELTAANFELQAGKPLGDMKAQGEISDYKVVVNPAQNVISTSKLTIASVIVPTGTARRIEVNNQFALSI